MKLAISFFLVVGLIAGGKIGVAVHTPKQRSFSKKTIGYTLLQASTISPSTADDVGKEEQVSRSSSLPDGKDELKSSKGGMQFMITSKMRQTLVNTLGYLESEVDRMEPQIAAVVIERSLYRPSSGMPTTWQVNGSSKAVGGRTRSIYSIQRNARTKQNGPFNKLRSYFKAHPALAFSLAVGAVCLWQLPTVASIAKVVGSSVVSSSSMLAEKLSSSLGSVALPKLPSVPTFGRKEKDSEKQDQNGPRKISALSSSNIGVGTIGSVKTSGASKLDARGRVLSVVNSPSSKASKVDIMALESVLHLSPADSMRLKVNILTSKF